jgi:hypothetical protein
LEWSLDEGSCAYRSSYGREMIFVNPAKNCGKYHFCFYLLCDASTFSCLMVKVATRNDSDPVDPEETPESIQQEANNSLLNKLVTVSQYKERNYEPCIILGYVFRMGLRESGNS